MGKPRKVKNREKTSFFINIRKRIAFQLLFWFLVIEFPVQVVLVYVSYQNAKNIIQEDAINNLSAIAERQVQAINTFFQQNLKDAELLATIPDIHQTTEALREDSLTDSTQRKLLQKYRESFGFKDVWIVMPQGKIALTASDSSMQGQILKHEQWKNTAIGRVFERANILLQADFSDFSMRNASKGELYIATPIRNTQKRFVGVLMVALDRLVIEQVMNDYTGLGKTGESLLITKINPKESIFANNTRHATKAAFKKNISLANKNQQGIAQALQGKSGSGIIQDYRDKEVFARWVYVPSLRSALIVKLDTSEAFAAVQVLRDILGVIVLITLTLVVLAAFSIASSFSKPIRQLTAFARQVAAGKLDESVKIKSENEIGELASAFNLMVKNLKESRDSLQDYAQNLEEKVAERTEELQAMNEEINQSNEELSTTLDFVNRQKAEIEKNSENMLASLNYAKRIQEAYLPSDEKIRQLFTDFFVMLMPRDVVSGDFYWFHQVSAHEGILAVGDCTGHGVPGAFMSILGNDILNSIIIQDQCTEVDTILNHLHQGVRTSLRQKETGSRDGMDISIIKLDLKDKSLHFAGAQSSMILIQEDRHYYIKGSKMGIGGVQREKERIFEKHIFPLLTDTTVYMYSDGFQDQFGGEIGRKFLGKRFRNLLYDIHQKSMEAQHKVLRQTFDDWSKDQKQLDDVLVLGAKICI